ncbi:MAG: hypothetical protein QOF51_4340 [Chloroflexota bacterium]|jgi:flavorubredoxin|nr:hypothetical protein [Chloroflexota bacterium]
MATHAIGDDVVLIAHAYVFPGEVTPLNTVLIQAARPLVVDTSAPAFRDRFLDDLRTTIRLDEIAYVAITHADPDHTGALVALLDTAPAARILTNAIGRTKLMGDFNLPAERFRLLNPGEQVDLGDRSVRAVWIPLFDQPETMAFFDERSRILCAADCFGAILPVEVAFADEIDAATYERGFRYWNQSNHPWVRLVDPARLAAELDTLRALEPRAIASAHGPVIRYDLDQAFNWIQELPEAPPYRFPEVQNVT